MDWLIENQAHIHCAQGNFSFIDSKGNEVLVQGKNGRPQAHLVKASRLLKGLRKGQQIFAVKLNKVEESDTNLCPDWLKEYADVFPEDLTNLPPSREVDHEIETIPGCEPISKRPYKMSLPEAIATGAAQTTFGTRIYSTEYFSLGCSSSFPKKKGWFFTTLHRLPRSKPSHCEEQVSYSPD